MRLFAFVVGGSVPGANTELHDVRFAVGARVEDCFASLKAQWWGTPSSLHLDAWGPLDWADGHAIAVVPAGEAGADTGPALWFVNMGGYIPGEFGEAHHNLFLTARDGAEAKAKGVAAMAAGWSEPHRDYAFEVDGLIRIEDALGGGWRLSLTPDPEPKPFRFETGYWPMMT